MKALLERRRLTKLNMGFGILLLLTREGELAEIIVGIYDRNKRMIPDDVLMKVENYSDAICSG